MVDQTNQKWRSGNTAVRVLKPEKETGKGDGRRLGRAGRKSGDIAEAESNEEVNKVTSVTSYRFQEQEGYMEHIKKLAKENKKEAGYFEA